MRQVQDFEHRELNEKAWSARRDLLAAMADAEEEEFRGAADFLVREAITFRGTEDAESIEPIYTELHSLLQRKLGPSHLLPALAKRKLAKVCLIQGRLARGTALVEEALAVFRSQLGKESEEAIEAVNTLMEWYGRIDPARANIFCEQVWLEYPLCEHLKPVEDHLLSHGVEVSFRRLGPKGIITVIVKAKLDTDSLRTRLQLNPCVQTFSDPPGPHSWYIEGFRCEVHRHLIAGDQDPIEDRPVCS
jgi:hypothetical protein